MKRKLAMAFELFGLVLFGPLSFVMLGLAIHALIGIFQPPIEITPDKFAFPIIWLWCTSSGLSIALKCYVRLVAIKEGR